MGDFIVAFGGHPCTGDFTVAFDHGHPLVKRNTIIAFITQEFFWSVVF
jgi:hypothetical protein